MRETIQQRKDELISDLISARQAVTAEITGLAEGQLDEPCIGIWCVKDLLAHLIGWDYTNLQAVQEILAGQRPAFFQYYDKDWRGYNARLVALYRKEPFDKLLWDAETSQQELVDFLRSLPAKDLLRGKSPHEQGRTVTIRTLLKSEANDERKHAEQVRAFFASAA